MAIFLWIVVAILGLATWIARRLALNKVAKAAAWPTTQGKVIDQVILSRGWQYFAGVSYAYMVDGKGYASDQMRPGGKPFFYTRARAKASLTRFLPGGPILVHFNPSKPGQAAVELVPLSFGFRALAFMTAFLAFFALVATVVSPLSDGADNCDGVHVRSNITDTLNDWINRTGGGGNVTGLSAFRTVSSSRRLKRCTAQVALSDGSSVTASYSVDIRGVTQLHTRSGSAR